MVRGCTALVTLTDAVLVAREEIGRLTGGMRVVALVATLLGGCKKLATNGDATEVGREERGRLTEDMIVVTKLVGGCKTLATVTVLVLLGGGEEVGILTGDSGITGVAILVRGSATVNVVIVELVEGGVIILIKG